MGKCDRIDKEEALKYHSEGKAGKIEIIATKPSTRVEDLSLAYTPGVACPSLEIYENPDLAYEYTLKSNLIAVISNGTAVLGLGNIGALASKPVMEGKALLFKKFASIDSIDIEVAEEDPDKFIEHVKAISVSFGGINLEDIKAPECFYIEKRLKEETDIPVMHDDQHGTAIITSAALLNALEITNRKIEDIKIVVAGVGAAGVASAKMYKSLGAKHVIMVDSKGVINHKRNDLNELKKEFIIETDKTTLADALNGADMLLGLSRGDTVTREMVKSMADNPILFTLANPTPEIDPKIVKEVRSDAIIGTGRSDFPNQVNNVLAFPFIFRGALDVRATHITENMKLSASKALADLAKKEVPEEIKKIYKRDLKFSKDYLIPTPFDHRVLEYVSVAVAKSAMEDGVAKKEIDLEKYKEKLSKIEL